jgi:CheY-like chemotaxis protein
MEAFKSLQSLPSVPLSLKFSQFFELNRAKEPWIVRSRQCCASLSNDQLPTLVILDLILPKVSGLQLIAEWRADPRPVDIPIFVLMNKDLSQNEKEYLRRNTEAFFSKQEQWLEALTKQICRATPSVIAGEP